MAEDSMTASDGRAKEFKAIIGRLDKKVVARETGLPEGKVAEAFACLNTLTSVD